MDKWLFKFYLSGLLLCPGKSQVSHYSYSPLQSLYFLQILMWVNDVATKRRVQYVELADDGGQSIRGRSKEREVYCCLGPIGSRRAP